MIVKNKLTKETLDIPYSEFRRKFSKEIQRIFGRAMLSDSEQAREVPVGRYSAGTPNNPRRMRLKVIAKRNQINTLGTSKMTILWSLIFILSYIGICGLAAEG